MHAYVRMSQVDSYIASNDTVFNATLRYPLQSTPFSNTHLPLLAIFCHSLYLRLDLSHIFNFSLLLIVQLRSLAAAICSTILYVGNNRCSIRDGSSAREAGELALNGRKLLAKEKFLLLL